MTDKRSAILVSKGLEKSMRWGTAQGAQILGWNRPSGGKTGTSSDSQDLRFVGYTSTLTTGVWVGMDNGKPVSERAAGSNYALPLWTDFMKSGPARKYPANPLFSSQLERNEKPAKAKPLLDRIRSIFDRDR